MQRPKFEPAIPSLSWCGYSGLLNCLSMGERGRAVGSAGTGCSCGGWWDLAKGIFRVQSQATDVKRRSCRKTHVFESPRHGPRSSKDLHYCVGHPRLVLLRHCNSLGLFEAHGGLSHHGAKLKHRRVSPKDRRNRAM